MHTLDGQMAYVKAYAGQGARAFVDPAAEENEAQLEKEFPGITFYNYKSERKNMK